jgi:hypothetical protein
MNLILAAPIKHCLDSIEMAYGKIGSTSTFPFVKNGKFTHIDNVS